MSEQGRSGKSRAIKTLGRTIGLVVALPGLIGYAVARPVVGRRRAFSLASERLAVRGGLLGVYARQAFYRYTTAGIGRDVCIGFMSVFSKPGVRLGHGVYIGRFCSLGWVHIHDHAMLADGVQVLSGRHQHGTGSTRGMTLQDNTPAYEHVTIGRGAWVGAGAIVMADVGEGAVVAAGAVVVKPVAAFSKVAGVPAVEIGDRAITGSDASDVSDRPSLAA